MKGKHVISFPYQTGTNRSAGVKACFDEKLFTKKDLQAKHPQERGLVGRIGAVRAKNKQADLAFVVPYFPPELSGAIGIYQRMVKWINKYIDSLATRTIPIICCDGNCRLGDFFVTDYHVLKKHVDWSM